MGYGKISHAGLTANFASFQYGGHFAIFSVDDFQL